MPRRLPVAVLPTVAVATVALVAALAGCTPTATPTTTTSAGTPPAPTAHEPTTRVPTPSASASVRATPVGRTCSQLISANTMYSYNPGFVALSTWKPSGESAATQAAAYQGVACRWQNETSNDVIDLSVADLDAATIESLKDQAVSKSTMVPTYSGADEGYFSAAGGTGTAIVFVKGYWIVLTSQQFAEPGDAEPLADAVISALS